MKRHGFKGLGAGHGVQRKHRSPGSIGGCSTPGRVFKGLRMAGRMGNDSSTTQNLTIHAVDADKGLVLIQGAVPGPEGRRGAGPLRGEEPAAAAGGDDRADHRHPHAGGSPTAASSCPPTIFDVTANVPLMHQVVVAQLAAARQGTHKTKTRGEVSGGGKKPYRQKGTGRARQGSTRAPQFNGGGVVHGPTPRSYDQRTPKKMKAAALRGALSDRARDGRVHVRRVLWSTAGPSTKTARAALGAVTSGAKHPRGARPRTTIAGWKSLRNVPRCTCSTAGQLNTYDVLVSDDVVFTRGRLDEFLAGPGSKERRRRSRRD